MYGKREGKDTADRSILIFFSATRVKDRKGLMRDQDEKLKWDFSFSQHTVGSVCDKRTMTSHISVLRHSLCFYNGPTARFDLNCIRLI